MRIIPKKDERFVNTHTRKEYKVVKKARVSSKKWGRAGNIRVVINGGGIDEQDRSVAYRFFLQNYRRV
ncbi:MAG: hypothetical protein KAS32_20075 [Candidatus Peribacteraceae bacterium]|nr:hypothetical protein [Candidatus Peribacteraceae bacterium]